MPGYSLKLGWNLRDSLLLRQHHCFFEALHFTRFLDPQSVMWLGSLLSATNTACLWMFSSVIGTGKTVCWNCLLHTVYHFMDQEDYQSKCCTLEFTSIFVAEHRRLIIKKYCILYSEKELEIQIAEFRRKAIRWKFVPNFMPHLIGGFINENRIFIYRLIDSGVQDI